MQNMKFGKNIKNMIVFGAVVIMLASVLSSCGNGDTSSKKSVDSSGSSQNSSSGSLVGDKYINYINSFTDEVGAFVNGDMDKVLNGVGSLSQDNYAEWKALYEKGLDSTEHWYSEVGAAAMLCGEDQKEKLSERYIRFLKVLNPEWKQRITAIFHSLRLWLKNTRKLIK